MKRVMLFLFVCVAAVTLAMAADGKPADSPDGAAMAAVMPTSPLFDELSQDADVVYLIANSSVIFGPDPHGRSEEITFVGPVTVPKWPMKGYGRRVLPDGRQQIDIELTQSELTGESYALGGPVVLGEHPDLRSLGTITERPRPSGVAPASNRTGKAPKAKAPAAKAPKGAKPTETQGTEKTAATADRTTTTTTTATETQRQREEEVPADFVVERKVLLTTAKGILYNETAVPVRGRIDSIPPVRFQGTPTGVNVFRGMELPVALLDQDGNVNGWFYSKAHMAYAVKPAGIERAFIKGKVQLRSGGKTEDVEVSGPVEIHHLTLQAGAKNDVEVMVLALRGRSELLGGDIMFTETFSDRDHFSRGQLSWLGKDSADSNFNLFVDLYTPGGKLTTQEPLPISGKMSEFKVNGRLDKGKLQLATLGGKGRFATSSARSLYNEAEKAVVDVVKMEFELAERM